MAKTKDINNEGISALVRNAGREAKKAVETSFNVRSQDDKSGIFNILDYIEQPWGLNRNESSGIPLWPAQRFLVKLYYNMPLDTTQRVIEVRDMFGSQVKYRFTEVEYLRYLFSEQRCNIGEQDTERRELVLAIGRRSGKCIDRDSLVLTNNGIFRIEDLGHSEEGGFSESEIGIVQEGARRATAKAFYNGGIQPTFRVTTKSGYQITGTGNHRVKVMSVSGKVEWRYLSEIQTGEYVAINRTTDLWASDYLDLKAYQNNDGYKNVELPSILDERLGNLLGYLVGDGTWNDDHSVSVTVEHFETWEYLQILMQEVFGEPRIQMDKRTDNTGRLEFCSVRARRFLSSIGWEYGTKRDQKMVPWSILRSPKSVVCAFLRGLFETDGCSENGGSCITFSSASFRLAKEVQTLLLNLGIVSTVSKKWVSKTRKYYAILFIKGVRSRQNFADLVGFDSQKKNKPLLLANLSAQEGKSSTDSVPCQYPIIRKWLESIPKRNPAKGELGWGRSLLRKSLGNTCKISTGENLTYVRIRRAIDVAKELGAGLEETNHFEELLRLDYFYDPVSSIEDGESQVYDLTVPDGQSFVANGMTNHNTTLSSIFASYELYRILSLGNPQNYYGLPEGNRIQFISIATDKEQAGILFSEVTNHLTSCEFFKPFIANDTQQFVNIRTPHDIERYGATKRNEVGSSLAGKSSLRLTFKGSNGKGLRGFGNIVVIMDEMAHFIEDGGASAKEVYDAVTPSTAAYSPKDFSGASRGDVESRVITISSPLNKAGKFYELYQQAMHGGDAAKNMLAVQAPTWEVNPTVPSSYYRQKYQQDPAVFMVEHGAQFSDRVRGWIEREEYLMECVMPEATPKERGVARYPHQMGIDIGLVNDGTAIFITHVEGDKVILDYHEIWEAGKSWYESNPHLEEPVISYAKTLPNVERIEFEEITNWIESLTKRFYITAGLFDRWNGIPLEQNLRKRGLMQFKSEFFTTDMSSRIYQTAKMLMIDRKLELYNYVIPKKLEVEEGGKPKNSPFIAELLKLEAEQRSKNLVVVRASSLVGNHDDMSDAYVRAVWLSSEMMTNSKHMAGTRHKDPNAPRQATTGNAVIYQARRARSHGVFTERMVPKGLRGRRR